MENAKLNDAEMKKALALKEHYFGDRTVIIIIYFISYCIFIFM